MQIVKMNAVIVKYVLLQVICIIFIAAVSTDKTRINTPSTQTTTEEPSGNSTRSLSDKLFWDVFSEWTRWGRCSKACIQSRKRKCKKSEFCGRSVFKDERPCTKRRGRCPTMSYVFYDSGRKNRLVNNKFYKPWSSWTSCSKTCTRHRRRKCKKSKICGGSYLEEQTECQPRRNSNCHKIYTFTTNILEEKDNKKKEKSFTKNFTLSYFNQICGYQPSHKKGSYRIIGGRDSLPHSWPWQVLILNRRKKHFCGGTLITPEWVLTAAHCIRKRGRQRKVVVRIGEHNISASEGTEQDVQVKKDFPHPNFDYKTIINDIALLKLNVPVNNSKFVSYACLPTKAPKVHRRQLCKTIGWGKTKMTNLKGSDVLQEADIPIIKKKKCKRAFDFTITNTQICAGYKKGGIDSCTGDSGGPLLCPLHSKHNVTRWYVTGVTSYGEECGQRGKFGIYTNVFRYIPWITKVINENS